MSRLNGKSDRARSALERYLSLESPTMRSKVYEIIHLSGLEPDDPMFLVLALTGQMRVFLEAAPMELGQLLAEWKFQNASSLSEIMSAISLVKQTQLEQASLIKENMEAQRIKCISDIKEAGMTTVSAIAEANQETLEQIRETKKQNEELLEEIKILRAEALADKQSHIENMNALTSWVNKTTNEFKLTHKQIDASHSELKKLQLKTFWLKLADWYSPLSALTIVGGAGLIAGGWLTFQKYNGSVERFGRNITDWNLDRIVKCQNDKNPKCTIWIVPPGSPQRNE